MQRYFRLANLVELIERKIASMDDRSEYLLYTDEKYKEISKEISKLLESVTETKADLKGYDDGFKEQFRKEFGEIERRAKVAVKVLSLADQTNQAIEKAFPKEERARANKGILGEVGGEALKVTIQKSKEAEAALAKALRFKSVIAEVKKNYKDDMFSTQYEPERLQDILDGNDDKGEKRLEALPRNSAVYSHVSTMINNDKGDRQIVMASLLNGSLQRSFYVDSNGDFKSNSLDPVTGAKETVKTIIESKTVQNIIKHYKEAEQFWLATSLDDNAEKDSRRAFVEAHADELKALYHAANVTNEGEPQAVLGILRENGIVNLIKDYHEMILDRKLEAKGEAISLNDERVLVKDRWTAKNDNYMYLYSKNVEAENAENAEKVEKAKEAEKAEKAFRSIRSSSSLSEAKIGDVKASEAQILGLKEFHKWIYRNCDARGMGDAFGANSSARAYMENFIKKPYDVQIKTLYMLEHRNRKEVPSNDLLTDYVPSLTDIKETMVATRFKFWRRLNGKMHRWNKVKDCVDCIAQEELKAKNKPEPKPEPELEQKLEQEPKQQKSRTDRFFEAAGEATNIADKFETGIDTVRNSGNTVKQAYTLFVNRQGNSFTATAGDVANVYWAGTSIYDTGKNLIRTVKSIREGEYKEASSAALDTINSGATSYVASAYASGAVEAATNFSVWTGIFGISRALIALVKGWFRRGRHSESVENKVDSNKISPEIMEKLKKHETAIAGINYGKRRGYVIDTVQGSVGLGNSIAGGAYSWWTGALAEAVAPWTLGLVLIGIPIFTAVRNLYNAIRTRKVADKLFYKDEETKRKIIDAEKKKIDKRLKRLPESHDYDDIRKYLQSVKESDSKILDHLRSRYATEKGCVNEKQFKGVLVEEMSKDLRNMHYNQYSENPEEAAELKKAADYLLDKAGRGSKLEHDDASQVTEQEKAKEIASIMKGL